MHSSTFSARVSPQGGDDLQCEPFSSQPMGDPRVGGVRAALSERGLQTGLGQGPHHDAARAANSGPVGPPTVLCATGLSADHGPRRFPRRRRRLGRPCGRACGRLGDSGLPPSAAAPADPGQCRLRPCAGWAATPLVPGHARRVPIHLREAPVPPGASAGHQRGREGRATAGGVPRLAPAHRPGGVGREVGRRGRFRSPPL
jgi:hypothetical protein